MKQKIVVILIIILIICLSQNTFSRFYEKLEKTLIKAEIAEPIIKFESMNETIKVNNFNKNVDEKEYTFKIKNYEIIEDGKKKISEVSFDYVIEINNKNNNFPVKYKLYDKQNGEEIILNGNKSNKINIKKEKEFEKTYKLVVMWDETKKMDASEKSTDIEILVRASQNQS